MTLMRPIRRLLPAFLLPLAMTVACGDAPDDDPVEDRTVVVDSAGLSIVWSRVAGLPVRTVSATAELQVGSLDGEDALYDVRSIDRFADGSWVVANAGTQEILILDPDGSRRVALGGEGEGPGEFSSLGTAHVFGGDSIWAWDFQNARVTVFDSTGKVGRTFGTETLEGQTRASPVARLADGRFVASGGASFGGDMQSQAVIRPQVTSSILGADGSALTTISTLPGSAQWLERDERSISIRPVPYEKDQHLTASADRIYVGVTENPEIFVHDATGSRIGIVRLDLEPEPVGDADWEAARDAELEAIEDIGFRNGVAEFYKTAPRPATKPVWSDLLTSEEGWLWVERFSAPGSDGPTRWWRFDPDGALIDEVEVPAGFTPMWAEGDLVAGIFEDEFEVEYLRVHRIK